MSNMHIAVKNNIFQNLYDWKYNIGLFSLDKDYDVSLEKQILKGPTLQL